MSHPLRKIVILGGGFGGISAAKELGRLARRDSSIEVHLVSNENYFVFQPMLPEVVASRLEASHILNPIRQLCPHVVIQCAAVRSIDPAGKTVMLVGLDSKKGYTLQYDHLILALGLTIDLTRNPGMREHSLTIKTMGDAFHLRNHILQQLEAADMETDPEAAKKAMTFVTVGGGFSGVETIAEMNDMIKASLKFYPQARAIGRRIVLVHSRERILQELEESLAEFAQAKLRSRGVEIILNTRVKEATPEGIVLSNGQTVRAGTIVSSVGNAPHPLICQTGLPQDRGRIVVDECMRVKDATDIWALGDSAMVPDVKRGGFCPPTAQYALRQGKRCAKNVWAVVHGGAPSPFKFGGLGQLAIVGHRCGVAQVFGIKVAGILAWFMWRTVYWSKLPGLRCKVRVGIDWALDLIFPRDISMLQLHRTDRLLREHYSEGQVIIRQGEIGDRFYIIESGEVEILIEGEHGTDAKRVRTCCAGESFGEIALLEDTPRTATVRCLTPVEVVTVTKEDFKSLVGSFAVVRDYIGKRSYSSECRTEDHDMA